MVPRKNRVSISSCFRNNGP